MSKKSDDAGFDKLKENVKKKRSKMKAQKDNSNETKNVNGENNVNGNGNVDVNSNINIIKTKKESKIKRTYYIKPEHDKKINELSRKSGRDKSELIRMAIDFFYNNVSVE